MGSFDIVPDFVEIPIKTGDSDCLVSWHPPEKVPDGKANGSGAVCSRDNKIIIVSSNNRDWDLPQGKPEGNETFKETVYREVKEEACAEITNTWLLGYNRLRCIKGQEKGLEIVRSWWHADVNVLEWKPEHEMVARKLLPAPAAFDYLPALFTPFLKRIFFEAGYSL